MERQHGTLPIESAARAIGRNLKHGAIVVLESMVYPGATEESPETDTGTYIPQVGLCHRNIFPDSDFPTKPKNCINYMFSIVGL